MAPLLPVAVSAHGDVFAEAKLAHRLVAIDAGDHWSDDVPQRPGAVAFRAGHPAVPASTHAADIGGLQLVRTRQLADGVAAQAVPDQPDLAAGQRVVNRSGQVIARPVGVFHLEAPQRTMLRVADAAVIGGDHVDTLLLGVFGEAAIEAPRNCCRARHHDPLVARRAEVGGCQPVAVGGGEVQIGGAHAVAV